MICIRNLADLDQQLSVTLDRGEAQRYNEDAMGEVRVKAKLTNAVDEALARGGMLKPEEVRTYDLVVDCVNRRLIPNPAHPDQPVSEIK